ncbi:hypothetical protein PGB90_000818 [Kerria lacca]
MSTDALNILEKLKAAPAPEELDKVRIQNLMKYLYHPNSYNTALSSTFPYSNSIINSIHVPKLPITPAASINPIRNLPSFQSAASVAHIPPFRPLISPQSNFMKPDLPVSLPLTKKPPVTVSEYVVHNPVMTVFQEEIRRPVFSELIQKVYKPVFTMLQQVYKQPLFTQHILKKPIYNAIKQKSQKGPLLLNGNKFHIISKAQAQVMELPPQYVQPFTTEILKTPIVPHNLQFAIPPIPLYQPLISNHPYYSDPTYGSGNAGLNSYDYENVARYKNQNLSPYQCKTDECNIENITQNKNLFINRNVQIDPRDVNQFLKPLPYYGVYRSNNIPFNLENIQLPRFIDQNVKNMKEENDRLITPQVPYKIIPQLSLFPLVESSYYRRENTQLLPNTTELTNSEDDNINQLPLIQKTAEKIMAQPEIMKILLTAYKETQKEINDQTVHSEADDKIKEFEDYLSKLNDRNFKKLEKMINERKTTVDYKSSSIKDSKKR